MATFSRSLDYVNGLKRRAVAARSFRTVVNSKSGTKFNSGNSFQIDLPVIPRTFGDLQNSYLMFKIKSTSSDAGEQGVLSNSGYDVINRITVSSGGGAVVSDQTNSNRYIQAVFGLNTGHEWNQGYSAECLGHGGDYSPVGIDLPADSSPPVTVCLPLIGGVFSMDKLLLLDTALPLSITIYLEDYRNALFNETGGTDCADYQILDPRFVMNCTELSPEAFVVLNEAVGDMGFAVNFTEITCTTDKKPASSGQHITNLGMRHSSLNKITLLQYDSGNLNNQAELLHNRSWGYLEELHYTINGVSYPQSHLKGSADNFSEFLTETLLANNTLGDTGSNNSLNYISNATPIASPGTMTADAAGGTLVANAVNSLRLQIPVSGRNYENARGRFGDDTEGLNTLTMTKIVNNIGTFVVSYDFSAFKSPVDDSGLYSGISSLAGNVTAEMKYGSSGTFAMDLYFFSESDRILSIDPVSRQHEVTD